MLRYLGTAVNEGDAISKKCLEDTGIKIEYITATTDDVTKRVITQPNSFDVLDTEYFSLKKLVPSGNIFALDAKKIKQFDNITPVFTKGQLPNGKKIGRPGHRALEGALSRGCPFQEILENTDRIRHPDPDGLQCRYARHPAGSDQAADFNPGANCSIPNSRARRRSSTSRRSASWMRRWWWRPPAQHKYADKGNMTKAEIDLTMKIMTEAKKAGQFRAFWKDFNESVNLMAVRRNRHSVDVVSRSHQGALDGNCLYVPAAQGRLSLVGVRVLRVEGGFGTEARLGL